MSKEIDDLEKQINDVDSIKEWGSKLKKMKEIKEKIILEKNKLNSLLQNLSDVKKNKKKKDLSLDECLDELETSNNIDEKVKLFSHIQYLIKESEAELFDSI
jgi:hypothetical protein